MTEPTQPQAGSEFFGAALEPALRLACGDRLAPIHWFRTDWQRGGALTGYSTWQSGDLPPIDVVVKLPVPPCELLWLNRLQPECHALGRITPLLLAGGQSIGGYDLAWVVMERMPHGPLNHAWNGREVDLLAEAVARFYQASAAYPVDQPPRQEPWAEHVRRSRNALKELQLPEAQRWNAVLKTLQKKLDKLLRAWDKREPPHWCHGDLHLANLMTHQPAPAGPAMLLDFARVHAGHWLEDAIYFEHLYWSRMQRLAGRDAVKQIAHHRREHRLQVADHWPHLANIRRCLVAGLAPARQVEQSNPHHLHASLAMLEKLLPSV